MRDDIRRFQQRANAAPRQMWAYDDVSENNNMDLMRESYQGKADGAPRKAWANDDVQMYQNPMAADMRNFQQRADGGHPAMMASDDIRLGRLYGRKSGSMMRSSRVRFGALPNTSSPINILSGTEDSWFTWSNAAIVAAVGLVGYGVYRLAK